MTTVAEMLCAGQLGMQVHREQKACCAACCALTGELDVAVTGRMHLSIACMRAGTIPIVMMGTGKG